MNTSKYKTILEQELKRIEDELNSIAVKNGTWEAKQTEVGEDTADKLDVAESIENYELNESVVSELEKQREDIVLALDKIANDEYGICEICGQTIEEEKLDADPSTKTCKKDSN